VFEGVNDLNVGGLGMGRPDPVLAGADGVNPALPVPVGLND